MPVLARIPLESSVEIIIRRTSFPRARACGVAPSRAPDPQDRSVAITFAPPFLTSGRLSCGKITLMVLGCRTVTVMVLRVRGGERHRWPLTFDAASAATASESSGDSATASMAHSICGIPHI